MLDQAFEALKTYDWGKDRNALMPIDQAVIAAHGNEAASKDLENRLAAVLKTDASRDAKDYVCRKLMIVASAASVPTLAEKLSDKDLSHISRYALERIPAPEAAQALRDAMGKLSGDLKIGMISSLGVRQDKESVPALAALLAGGDAAVARAAAYALGDISTAEAAKALGDAKPSDASVKLAACDGSLSCAEQLLADGKNGEALVVYKSLAGEDQPKHIRLAATRGMLACAGKK